MRRFIQVLIISLIISSCTVLDQRIDLQGTALADMEGTVAGLSTQNAYLATQVRAQGTAVALATHVPYLSTQVMGLYVQPTHPGGALPTPSPFLPPVGLVYSTSDGLWQVDSSGQPQLLLEDPGATLSPDSRYALLTLLDRDTDIELWLADLENGEQRNLSNSPDRAELYGLWWPARPDQVILGSRSISEEPGPSTGHLSMISVETGEYRVLDPDNISNAYPAPSPDGTRIAYDRGGSPWIYDLASGPEVFDLDDYDFYVAVGSQKITLASPSWSPDGKQLAWVMGGGLGEDAGYRIAIAVFDLENRNGQLFHPYIPVGRGGWPPAPIWSPDGQWLAFEVWSEDEPGGLWILRLDGSEERYLGDGSNPAWSPDGSQLAFNRYDEHYSIWIARVGEWEAEQVYLPSDAIVKAWRSID